MKEARDNFLSEDFKNKESSYKCGFVALIGILIIVAIEVIRQNFLI